MLGSFKLGKVLVKMRFGKHADPAKTEETQRPVFFSWLEKRFQSIHALLHLFCVGAEAEAFREDVYDNVTMSDFSMVDTVDYMVTSTMILMKNHQSILPEAYKRAHRP